jgi:hypothetical protein
MHAKYAYNTSIDCIALGDADKTAIITAHDARLVSGMGLHGATIEDLVSVLWCGSLNIDTTYRVLNTNYSFADVVSAHSNTNMTIFFNGAALVGTLAALNVLDAPTTSPPPDDDKDDDDDAWSDGTIVGIVLGAALGMVALSLAIVLCDRRTPKYHLVR